MSIDSLSELLDNMINVRNGIREPGDRQVIEPIHPLLIFVYVGHNTLVKSNLFRALLEIALQTDKSNRVRVSSLMSCLYFGSILKQGDLMGLDYNTIYQFVVSEVTDENDSHQYPSFRMRDLLTTPLGADFNKAVMEIIRLQCFTHTPKEGPWTDKDTDDIICQLWILLSKAATNCSKAASCFPELFAKFAPDFQIAPANRIRSNTAMVSAQLIGGNLCIRRAMIHYIISVTRRGTAVNQVQGVLIALSEQLADLGLISFVLTKKYGGIAKNTFLDPGVLSYDLHLFNVLKELYECLGDLGRYMTIYEHPQRWKFSPGNYPRLFSFVLGYAIEVEPSMRNCKYNTNVLSEQLLALGTAAAKVGQRRGSVQTVVEQEVSEEKGHIKEEHERSSPKLDDNLKRTRSEGLDTESRRAVVHQPWLYGATAVGEAGLLTEQRDLAETKEEAQNSYICSGTFATPSVIPHIAPSLGNLPTRGTRPQTTTFADPKAGAIPKRLHSHPEGSARKADIEALAKSQLQARLEALRCSLGTEMTMTKETMPERVPPPNRDFPVIHEPSRPEDSAYLECFNSF